MEQIRAFEFDDIRLLPVTPTTLDTRKQAVIETKIGDLELKFPFLVPPMHSLYNLPMVRNLMSIGGIAILPRNYDIPNVLDKVILNSSMDTALFDADRLMRHWEFNFNKAGQVVLSIEIANGHMAKLADKIKEVKDHYPQLNVWAGTVCTPEGVVHLIDAGATAALIGIGVGSSCTTTPMTGIGLPPLFTSLICAETGHPTILTGGIRKPGDVCKALAVGVDAVYIGALIKGCQDTASPEMYWGEASAKQKGDNHYVEGKVEVLQPKTELSSDVFIALREHLQSTMSYSDSFSLQEFRNKARYIQVR